MSQWVIEKPLPVPIPETRGFWDGTKAGELRVQVCGACGHTQLPGGPACAACWSPDLAWRAVSGRGAVFSFTVVHHAFHPAFASECPYVVADVELEEGPIITSRVVGCDPRTVEIGMPVQVTFERVSDEIALPLFTPRSG